MMRARGNVYVYIAAALVAVALLYFGIGWINTEIEDGKKEAARAARAAALLEVAQRDNKQLADAQAEILRLTDEKERLERASAERIAKLDKEKTDELAKVERRKDSFISDVVSGRVRLHDPGRKADSCGPGGNSGKTTTADAAAGVGDGPGGAELSAALAGFLGGEAGRADKVVVKLAACQGIVKEYLTACNAENPR